MSTLPGTEDETGGQHRVSPGYALRSRSCPTNQIQRPTPHNPSRSKP